MATEWHRVLDPYDLPEGRVTTVHAGLKELALVHFDVMAETMVNWGHDGPAMVAVMADAELV